MAVNDQEREIYANLCKESLIPDPKLTLYDSLSWSFTGKFYENSLGSALVYLGLGGHTTAWTQRAGNILEYKDILAFRKLFAHN